MKKHVLACSIIFIFSGANAQENDKGLSGEISILSGFGSETSHFNTENKQISSLTSSADTETGVMLAPVGELGYTFDDEGRHHVFLATSREEFTAGDMTLEIGYKTKLQNNSELTFSVLPGLMAGETWQEPYLTGANRSVTDVSGNAFRVQYQAGGKLPFSADLAYYTSDVDEERSGTALLTDALAKSLQRSGSGTYLSLGYRYKLDEVSMLKPTLIYHVFDADGAAMSFASYGAEIEYMRQVDQHRLFFSSGYSITSFDQVNPLFNKTQDDSKLSISAGYGYENFMGWEDWGFKAMAGYSVISSNIDFYDEEQYTMGVGLTYRF